MIVLYACNIPQYILCSTWNNNTHYQKVSRYQIFSTTVLSSINALHPKVSPPLQEYFCILLIAKQLH